MKCLENAREYMFQLLDKMATSQEFSENFRTCPICSEVFNQPCSLGCQHTFCQACLTKYIHTQPDAIKARSISCPFCRIKTAVIKPEKPVEEWAAQFTPGLVIKNLLDSFGRQGQDTNICTLCREEGKTTQAQIWCSECDASLCEGCLELHEKILASRCHEISDISLEGKTIKKKKHFVCRKHSTEKVKLFCKDHKKAICTVCCSIEHRACKEIVTLEDMIPEVKQAILNHKDEIQTKLQTISEKKTKREKLIRSTTDKAALVKSDIKTVVKNVIDMMKGKENKLLDEVDCTLEKQLSQLKSDNKLTEMTVQMYQQQSEVIDQAASSECEMDMYEMYELCQSEIPPSDDVTLVPTVSEMKLIDNMDRLREAIDMMSISDRKGIDLEQKPVLVETIDVKMEGDTDIPNLHDVEVMKVNGITTVVVTDCGNSCIKSVYLKNTKPCHSHLKVGKFPWQMTKMKDTQVAVTVPGCKQIVIVDVSPDLNVIRAFTKEKGYYGIAALNPSSLVVSSWTHSSVDILDTSGNIMMSFKSLPSIQKTISSPRYLHMTQKGHIIVSDNDLKSVICLTQTGNVSFNCELTGDREVECLGGLVTTTQADILFADMKKNKVIHLTETGQFVRDILTSQEGAEEPAGLCIDGDILYVAMRHNVKLFKMS